MATSPKKELDKLINDLYDSGEKIRALDKLMTQVKDQKLRDTYNESLVDMIKTYKTHTMIVKAEIKKYIVYERKEKLPVQLMYRRLVKSL